MTTVRLVGRCVAIAVAAVFVALAMWTIAEVLSWALEDDTHADRGAVTTLTPGTRPIDPGAPVGDS